MKKTLKFSCLVITGMTMAACSNEAVENAIEVNNSEGISFVIENFKSEDNTRASYTITDNDVSVSFGNDDVIGVWGSRTGVAPEQVSFRIEDGSSITSDNVVFDGGLWRLREDATKYAAFYPYTDNCYSEFNSATYQDEKKGVTVYYTNSSFSDGNSLSNLSNSDFMACGGVSVSGGSANFTLKHLGSLVHVKFEGLPAEATTVQKLILSLSEDLFISEGKVDMTVANPAMVANANPNMYPPTTGLTNCLSMGGYASVAEGKADIYFMCGPTNLTGKTIAIKALTDKGAIKGEVEGKNMEAGKRYVYAPAATAYSGVALSVTDQTTISNSELYTFTPTEDGLYTVDVQNGSLSSFIGVEDGGNYPYYPLTAGVTYFADFNFWGGSDPCTAQVVKQ